MGVNAVDGRWASLVNVAPPAGAVVDPAAPSRGVLAERFIAATPAASPAQFARQQAADEAVGQMATKGVSNFCDAVLQADEPASVVVDVV